MDPIAFLFELSSAAMAIKDKTAEEREAIVASLNQRADCSRYTKPTVLFNCSPAAMRKCPDAALCHNNLYPAQYAAGSDCDKFNKQVESNVTVADAFHLITDENLAKFFDWMCDAVKSCDGCPFKGKCPAAYNEKQWLDFLSKPASTIINNI